MDAQAPFPSRADSFRHLKSSEVFSSLDDDAISRLAECTEPMIVQGGELIMREGDAPDDAFIIISGRLVVSATGTNGEPSVIAELGPGQVVGEMALLSGSPRSATARALRDTHLLRLSGLDFTRVVNDDPRLLLDMTRTIVTRLDRSIHDRRPPSNLSVIAVVPAGAHSAHRSFANDLTATQALPQTTEIVTWERVEAEVGTDSEVLAITSYLHQLEDRADLTLLVADEDATDWTSRCIRQADLILLIGRAADLGKPQRAEDTLGDPEDTQTPVHLVLVHDAENPSDTDRILAGRRVDRHHHLHRTRPEDLERLARVVTGSSTGVVLGGGGARGFAHFGVLQALTEAGIPIDHIGGSSMGSSMAAGFAFGWEVDRMIALEEWVTVDRGSLIDISLPAVAVASGSRLTSGMRSVYGDQQIEDLWTDFFCVSTDLVEGNVYVHTTGPVWQAVRASVAIPGIFPPVRLPDGHLLVDGGVLNNLPTDIMADRFSPGTLIAVDLQAPFEVPSSDLASDGVVSGWRVAGRRLARWKPKLEVPGMIEILARSNSIAGNHGAELADLVLRPPTDHFGTLQFGSSRDIYEAGYHYAVDALEQWEGLPDPGQSGDQDVRTAT